MIGRGKHSTLQANLHKTLDRLMQKTLREPAIYTVSEYEDGWFVEQPDPSAPLEDCKFIQVYGPYKRESSARRKVAALNGERK